MSGEKIRWADEELPEAEAVDLKDVATLSAEEMERRIRLERLKKRREDFVRDLKEVPAGSEDAAKIKMDFYEQQGDDLIIDEALKEEWNEHVVAPGKEGYTFGEVPIEQALEAMEMLVEGKDFPKVEKAMRTNFGRPEVDLATARLVARFSEKGYLFAKYAGIADLNEKDPKGYWRTVKHADGRYREPFEKEEEVIAKINRDNSAESREFREWFKWYKGYNNGELEAIWGELKNSGGIYEYDGVNGKHVLTSTMSIDDIYQEVLGYSKEHYARNAFELTREIEEERERLERKAEEKIPSWIERGKALIYPEQFEEWTNAVKTHAKGVFYGADVEDALGVMEKLEAGVSVEKIRKEGGSRNYIGNTFGAANALVFAFSKRGPEFITGMLSDLSLPEVVRIADKQRQNERLASFTDKKAA